MGDDYQRGFASVGNCFDFGSDSADTFELARGRPILLYLCEHENIGGGACPLQQMLVAIHVVTERGQMATDMIEEVKR